MRPDDPMRRDVEMLKRFGPLLVSFWGWAALALSAPKDLVVLGACGAGLIAAGLMRRAFAASAVVEGVALLVVIAVAAAPQIGFVALGALFVVAARVAARIARPIM